MYSRDVSGRVRNFEASGSLYHSALVMRDNVTDSFWAVISSEAIGGADQGTPLEALQVSEKITWGEWKSRHPSTVILSVDGVEDVVSSPYENYYNSDETHQDMKTADTRLPNKEPVFAFQIDDRQFAIPHAAIEGGWVGQAGGTVVFLFRPEGASIYRSTAARRLDWTAAQLRIEDDGRLWVAPALGPLDPGTGKPTGEAGRSAPLEGLDTFWHIWSTYHTSTELLEAAPAPSERR